MKTAPILAGLAAIAWFPALSVPPKATTAPKATVARSPSTATGAARDVRCLMLANMYAKVAAASQGKEAAGQARLFYLGRVSSRLADAQLASTMSAQAKTIDPATAGKDMNACAATVQASAAAVETAGTKVRATIAPSAPAGPVAPPADAGAASSNSANGSASSSGGR